MIIYISFKIFKYLVQLLFMPISLISVLTLLLSVLNGTVNCNYLEKDSMTTKIISWKNGIDKAAFVY